MALKWYTRGIKLVEYDPWYIRFSPNPGIGGRLTLRKYRFALSTKRGFEIFKAREVILLDPPKKVLTWLPVYRRLSSTLKRI